MKLVHLRSIAIGIFLCGLGVTVGAQHAAPLQGSQTPANAQSSSKSKAEAQSKSRKVANPLNDLLGEAQRHIDAKEFEAAVAPLQTVIAPQPDFAYDPFQLAYVYTALKKSDEANAA